MQRGGKEKIRKRKGKEIKTEGTPKVKKSKDTNMQRGGKVTKGRQSEGKERTTIQKEGKTNGRKSKGKETQREGK